MKQQWPTVPPLVCEIFFFFFFGGFDGYGGGDGGCCGYGLVV